MFLLLATARCRFATHVIGGQLMSDTPFSVHAGPIAVIAGSLFAVVHIG